MIKPSGETVLLYNLDNDKGRKLRFLLVRMGMRIRVVNPEEYSLPVGVLAGMKDVVPEKADAEAEVFSDGDERLFKQPSGPVFKGHA